MRCKRDLHASSDQALCSIGMPRDPQPTLHMRFRLEAARLRQNLNATSPAKGMKSSKMNGRRSCPRTAELGLRQVLAPKRLMNLRSEAWARWTYSW